MNRFFFALTSSCLASMCAAQSLVTVGPGGYACPSNNPPDSSQASGNLLLHYDPATAILRVLVTNTSPGGEAMPEIRRLWLAGPAGAVTQAQLLGPVNRFELAFEPAPGGASNRADCFGSFMFQLSTSPRQLGITTTPVELLLQLAGPAVHSLGSASFATATGQGGDMTANVALRFENGGNSEKFIVANSTPPLTAPAGCVIYNGNGINPVQFRCQTLPVIGTIWQLDTTPNSSTAITLLGMSLAPSAPIPLLGGELLIDTTVLALFFGPGTYEFPVPSYPGFSLYLQAARVDNGTIVILNAIHATLGL